MKVFSHTAEGSTAQGGVDALDSRLPRRGRAADFALNAALLLALWFAYSLVRRVTADEWSQAILNSGNILQLQDWLGLPHEGAFQQLLLDRPRLIRAANIYYMWAHFPVTAAFVVWAWLFHRRSFSVIRNTLIGVTGAGLILHLVYPLVPPRKLPGFIDTGVVFGPSPYDLSASEAANQLAAMPSLHVGWAVIVALSIISLSRSRWRLVALVHPFVTLAVVVLTANHYWIDAVVAIFLVAGAWAYSVKIERRSLLDLGADPVRAESVSHETIPGTTILLNETGAQHDAITLDATSESDSDSGSKPQLV